MATLSMYDSCDVSCMPLPIAYACVCELKQLPHATDVDEYQYYVTGMFGVSNTYTYNIEQSKRLALLSNTTLTTLTGRQ